MKDWFDHTEHERADMNEDDVSRFCDGALMEAGVLKPRDPQYKEVESAEPEKTETFYEVSGIFFSSAEDANRFAAMHRFKTCHDWNIGYDHNWVEPCEPETPTQKTFPTRNAIQLLREKLARIKEAKEHNSKEETRFQSEQKKANEVTSRIWDDYYSCQRLGQQYMGVMSTFDQYKAMTDGNRVTAFRFLQKAFTEEDIRGAFEWFDRTDEMCFDTATAEPETAPQD